MSILGIDYDKCNGCGLCKVECPRRFIEDEEDQKGEEADQQLLLLQGQNPAQGPHRLGVPRHLEEPEEPE